MQEKTKLKKLFIGIDTPKKLKEKIFEKLLTNMPHQVTPVKKENLHTTLLFFGFVDKEKEKQAIETLKEISIPEFKIKLEGINQFNDKVIWIKIIDEKNYLKKINSELKQKLKISEDSFHAHLTIARNKKLNKKETTELIGKLENKNFFAEVLVKEIILFESKNGSQGAEYIKVFSKNLT